MTGHKDRINVGDRFGRLEVVGFGVDSSRNTLALCRCECGKECSPRARYLLSGRTTSCGCKGREHLRQGNTRHGLYNTPEWRVFSGMKTRCNNPNDHEFANYGGRGIRITYANVEEFLQDVGPRPTPRHCIERIDTNGPYGPGNCVWATPAQNQQNRRNSKRWIINGREFASAREASDTLGVSQWKVLAWCNGWTDSKTGRHYEPRPGWFSEPKYPEPGRAARRALEHLNATPLPETP